MFSNNEDTPYLPKNYMKEWLDGIAMNNLRGNILPEKLYLLGKSLMESFIFCTVIFFQRSERKAKQPFTNV